MSASGGADRSPRHLRVYPERSRRARPSASLIFRARDFMLALKASKQEINEFKSCFDIAVLFFQYLFSVYQSEHP